MATKKAVVEEETLPAVATPAGALVVADYADDAGRGFEGESASDFSIPFIDLLQALSPQVNADDSYLRPGMFYNKTTQKAFSGKTGFDFVVGAVQHVVVEWVPREQGGGLVETHPHNYDKFLRAKTITGRNFGKFSTAYDKERNPIGNDLVETYYLYGVVCEDGEPCGMAVMALKSTNIGPFRKYNTRINEFKLRGPDGKILTKPDGTPLRIPRFAHLVKITSKQEQRTKGVSYNFVFEPGTDNDVEKSLLPRNDQRYQAARALLDLVEGGQAKAVESDSGEAEESGDSIPF